MSHTNTETDVTLHCLCSFSPGCCLALLLWMSVFQQSLSKKAYDGNDAAYLTGNAHVCEPPPSRG